MAQLTFPGIAMQLYMSFSIFVCQQMLKNEISSHRWRNSFLNPSKKKFLAFEWDLRDIDGATHFQGIALQFIFFNIFVKTC